MKCKPNKQNKACLRPSQRWSRVVNLFGSRPPAVGNACGAAATPLVLRFAGQAAATVSASRRLHLILDNYRIHSSTIVQAALGGYLAGKVILHFLPPYCPDHNKIERVWNDLHANVTRNHRCRDMQHLMREVRYYLAKRNRQTSRQRLAA